MDVSKELAAIKARNAKVEADKAWEQSWTRGQLIAVKNQKVSTVDNVSGDTEFFAELFRVYTYSPLETEKPQNYYSYAIALFVAGLVMLVEGSIGIF